MKKIFLSTFFFFGILSAYSQNTITSEPNKNWQIGIGYNQFWEDINHSPKPLFHFDISRAITKHWVIGSEVNFKLPQSGGFKSEYYNQNPQVADTLSISYNTYYLRPQLNLDYFIQSAHKGFYVGIGAGAQIFRYNNTTFETSQSILNRYSYWKTFFYSNLHLGYSLELMNRFSLKGQIGYGFSNLGYSIDEVLQSGDQEKNTNPVELSISLGFKF